MHACFWPRSCAWDLRSARLSRRSGSGSKAEGGQPPRLVATIRRGRGALETSSVLNRIDGYGPRPDTPPHVPLANPIAVPPCCQLPERRFRLHCSRRRRHHRQVRLTAIAGRQSGYMSGGASVRASSWRRSSAASSVSSFRWRAGPPTAKCTINRPFRAGSTNVMRSRFTNRSAPTLRMFMLSES
jgi:hypothetical protein